MVQGSNFEVLFHIHHFGSDAHSETPAEETAELVKEVMGIDSAYAGIHFRDPSAPEAQFNTDEIINSLEKRGVNPGIEFNIIQDESGWRLDLTPDELRNLKERHQGVLAIASIHAVKAFGFTKETDGENAPEQDSDQMLAAYLQIIEKYGDLVDVIGHPFQYANTATDPDHISSLAEAAHSDGIALEINAAQIGLKNLVSVEDFMPTVAQVAG